MTRPLPLGVLASGRGSNFQAIVKAIGEGRLDAQVRLLLTDVDGCGAMRFAESVGIPTRCLPTGKYKTRLSDEAEKEWVAALNRHGVEVIALAGFMRMLHENLLSAFSGRILNIHPSLLPAYQGLHAQKQAHEYGAKVTGCTVHFVDPGMDTGPIIGQRSVRVEEHDTEETLSARILEQEHQLYAECLQLMAEGRLKVEGRRVFVLGKEEGE